MKHIIIYSVIILSIAASHGCKKNENPVGPSGSMAWVNALQGSTISSIATSGADLFAGTYAGTVLLSVDNGSSWEILDTLSIKIPGNTNSLHTNSAYHSQVNTILVSGADIYAAYGYASWGGVFLSTNNGTSWTEMDSGLVYSSANPIAPAVNSLAVIGNNLFAGTDYGVYLSTNNGAGWTSANSGMSYQVMRLATIGTELFAGTTGEGVFLSTDNGTSWSAVNNGLTNTSIYGLASIGTNLFAGGFKFPGDSAGGVFLSSNNGANWSAVDTGMTNEMINVLVASGTNLFAGTNSGVFLSTNNGTSWADLSTGSLVDSSAVIALCISGSNIFVGTNGNGIWHLPL